MPVVEVQLKAYPLTTTKEVQAFALNKSILVMKKSPTSIPFN